MQQIQRLVERISIATRKRDSEKKLRFLFGTTCWKKKKWKKKRKTQQHRLRATVRVHGFNARLLTRSQFASGRSWDRPTRSRFSVVFLGPRANAGLVPKFHVAHHASHTALPRHQDELADWLSVVMWLRLRLRPGLKEALYVLYIHSYGNINNLALR
jgi:hypothetical protein